MVRACIIRPQLTDMVTAEAMYLRLLDIQKFKRTATMNKQKGEKKKVTYLMAMVNMLIEANSEDIDFDHDPRQLTTITRHGKPLRTLARRIDGAMLSAVNPVVVWEIKEYYHTKTFCSRVADSVTKPCWTEWSSRTCDLSPASRLSSC